MSSRDAEERLGAAPLKARLAAYYGRYYGGALGIPGWRDLVAVRLDDTAYERERLARVGRAVRRSLPGAPPLQARRGRRGAATIPPRARRPRNGAGGRHAAPRVT